MERSEERRLTLLDTHVVAWLYAGQAERLSTRAADAVETGRLVVSGMTILELEYLHEIGRLRDPADRIVATLAAEIDLERSDERLSSVATYAYALTWTRDPFDRMIAAEALLSSAALVTKDALLLRHVPTAVW